MSACTNCGRELQIGAVACGVCGAAVHGSALPPPHAAPPPPAPAYGAAPPPAAGYAPAPAVGYAPLPPAAAPTGKPKWLVPVVVVLVLAIGGGIAFMLSSGDDPKSTLGDTKTTEASVTDDTATADTTNSSDTLPVLTTKPTTGGGGTGTGYTPELRDVFVSSCTQPSASEALCGCVYDAIAATIPFDEFIAMSNATDGGASVLSDPRLVSAITACAGG
ncbi:unannotated protein [freshwater metagenome]|uniref:Unannotated protein n=1 Tax=freshwater metagenome TaxID=449393 RepID=A0A6J6ABZ7_9ZZZZ